jgi:signal transduction histidine kinase
VTRMGGRVGLESVEGTGSRFWLELPVARSAAPAASAAEPASASQC